MKLASSFSLVGAPISKRVRIQATLRNMVLIAKYLPGQILSGERFQYGRGGTGPRWNRWKATVTKSAPSSRPEHSLLRISDGRIEFPIFEEPFWVEGFRHGVDGLIAEHFPT